MSELSIPPAARRRSALTVGLLGALGLTILAAACADAPLAPRARPSETSSHDGGPGPSVSSGSGSGSSGTVSPTSVQGLLRKDRLEAPIVVVKTLSNSGGTISVPGTDFQLQVPSGAFEGKSMTFTITAYLGKVVAYDFQPHGVKFLKPLKGVQALDRTNWKSLNLSSGYSNVAGAYFADETLLNTSTGRAIVNEFMPCVLNVKSSTLTWDIPHFSGYMISVGGGEE